MKTGVIPAFSLSVTLQVLLHENFYAIELAAQLICVRGRSLLRSKRPLQIRSAVVLRKILHLLVQIDPAQLAVTVDVGGWCDHCWIVKGADSNHPMPRITFVTVENRSSAMATEMFRHTLSEMKG